VLKGHFSLARIETCRRAFWPILLDYLSSYRDEPNRGPARHFLPMPFNPPCFASEFFFDTGVLSIIHGAMDSQVVADQWGCDVPVKGSQNQEPHVDYQRPLFAETPDLVLAPYILLVSFGLVPITVDNGAIQIAPGTHRMPRTEAKRAVDSGSATLLSVSLQLGDVLIRHPWTIHRGTPNTTDVPRPLATIRYVRRWYVDNSREVNPIPLEVWQSLTSEQQDKLRFPIAQ